MRNYQLLLKIATYVGNFAESEGGGGGYMCDKNVQALMGINAISAIFKC